MKNTSTQLFVTHLKNYDYKALKLLIEQADFDKSEIEISDYLLYIHSTLKLINFSEKNFDPDNDQENNQISFYGDIFMTSEESNEYFCIEDNTNMLKLLTNNLQDFSFIIELANICRVKEFATLADLTAVKREFLLQKIAEEKAIQVDDPDTYSIDNTTEKTEVSTTLSDEDYIEYIDPDNLNFGLLEQPIASISTEDMLERQAYCK